MSKKGYNRKYAVSTMAAAAAVTAVAPVAASADTSTSFPDVQPGESGYGAVGSHYGPIMELTEKGIISGYPSEGVFKPWKNIYRGQVAKMMANALDLKTPEDLDKTLSVYNDVDASNDYAEDIAAVTAAGVFQGNLEKKKFGEYDPISREQMASVVVRAFNLDEIEYDKEVEINLNRVSSTHKDAVQTLANLGITTELDNFDAYSEITRAAFSSFLKRTMDVVEDSENQGPKVESVSQIDGITKGFGEAASEEILNELPATVKATLNDEASTEVELNVEWEADPDYSEHAAGEYTFTGTLSAGKDAEFTIPDKLSTINATVTVEAPTDEMIQEAVTAVNDAVTANDEAALLEGLQNPVLGLTDVREDLITKYVTEIGNSVTDSQERIQEALNRVNKKAAEEEQELVDAVNAAVNFADLRTALSNLGIKNVAAGSTFNKEYFDAIDANSTDTKVEIQTVIDTVNLDEITAAVEKAETDLTDEAYNAANNLVTLGLLADADQTDLEDRLAEVKSQLDSASAVENVNNEIGASVDPDRLLSAIKDAKVENVVDASAGKYATALEEQYNTDNDFEFANKAAIQDFVDKVNLEDATDKVEALTDEDGELVGDADEVQTAIDEAQAAVDLLGDGNKKNELQDKIEQAKNLLIVRDVNLINGEGDLRDYFFDNLAYAPFTNLGVTKGTEVAKMIINDRPEAGFADVAEIKAAIDTAINEYNGLITDVNNATEITDMQAALQAVADKGNIDIEVSVDQAEKALDNRPDDGYKSITAIMAEVAPGS